jgi:pimeloyl-ACP methyl ester carboxylesterase
VASLTVTPGSPSAADPPSQLCATRCFVSNLAADRFPLEQLTVPTLVISAKDDHLAPHRFAVDAAARIPGARFVAIDSGGHLLLARKAEVQKEVSAFVASVLANKTG